MKLQPKQPARARPPAPKHKEKIAAQQETKEQPAPAASSSSSSSSSGSHEIDQSDAEWTPPVPPKAAAVKAQKTSLARSQTVPTEVITTTEAEETQIEPSGSSLKTNSSPAAPKETTMEEPVRVTRARLRKASSIQ